MIIAKYMVNGEERNCFFKRISYVKNSLKYFYITHIGKNNARLHVDEFCIHLVMGEARKYNWSGCFWNRSSTYEMWHQDSLKKKKSRLWPLPNLSRRKCCNLVNRCVKHFQDTKSKPIMEDLTEMLPGTPVDNNDGIQNDTQSNLLHGIYQSALWEERHELA